MRTLVGVVLDRSGSMSQVLESTIEGFNSFVEEQREAGNDQVYVVAQFDSEYEVLQDGVELDDVLVLDKGNFVPRGMTHLLDAIGRTICALDAVLADDIDIDQVIMVILTDGGENGSEEFTRNQVFDLIKEREESGTWAFNFVGANQDAIAVGSSLGIRAANCMNYNADNDGTLEAFRGMSNAIRSYSDGGSADLSN